MKARIEFLDSGLSHRVWRADESDSGADIFDVPHSFTGMYFRDGDGVISPVTQEDAHGKFASDKQSMFQKKARAQIPQQEQLDAIWKILIRMGQVDDDKMLGRVQTMLASRL